MPVRLVAGSWAWALTVALAATLSAADSSGPVLTGPAQVLTRLASDANPAAESLVEMPLAEPTPSSKAGTPASSQASPLPTARTVGDRSVQLEQIAQQADRQTRQGFELASHGAYFAARSKFVGALRLIAEGLDSEQKTNRHCRSLAAATTALKEAEDFLPGGPRLEADLDLSGIVAAHATPVLKNKAEQMTPMTALRSYLTFAQEQFAESAGHEVAGSMALHAMGKLHAALGQKKNTLVVAPESKAMVFYQAALLVYPENPMASNDLGVLLAQCGHYGEARTMLEHSIARCPQPTGWQNLAVVYRQLKQPALAERASGQAALLRQAEVARRQRAPSSSNGVVQWVDPQTFAQTSSNIRNDPGVTPAMRGDALQAMQPATARATRPSMRSMAEVNRSAPTVQQPAVENYGPAPTPAAAGRMSWGSSVYQR